MKNLNDMLYFAQVVDSGSFAAAARALGMPQSTLSRRVADLETALGVRLLERTTRKLALTKIGETYHGHCAALKQSAQAAQDAIHIARAEPCGIVKVCCPISLAQTMVRPVLPEFLRGYPKVRIEMLVTNAAFEPMEQGIDVALRLRASLADSGGHIVKQFGRLATRLVASPALLQGNDALRSREALNRLPSVAMSTVEGWATVNMAGPGGAPFDLRHQPCCAADDYDTLKHLILDGIGIGVLPAYLCVAELGNGCLVDALPGWAPVPEIFHAVFPSRRGMAPAVRALLDFLAEHATTGVGYAPVATAGASKVSAR
jgi:DNA-binding transcriptional LysR family regulator